MIPSLVLWSFLRVLTSIFAALLSALRPITELEKNIKLWPPVEPLSDWLERVFLSPWYRWDAEWYTQIVIQGYSGEDGTTQFHPLYPMLATPLYRLGIHPVLSLLIISSVAAILLIYAIHLLCNGNQLSFDAKASVFLLFIAPPAFILMAPYPESLFLLWAVLCFYFSFKKKWWAAGVTGGLAVLTRQQGLFLIFPIAWELWESKNHNFRYFFADWRSWSALLLIPLSMGIWLFYRLFLLGDLKPDLSSFHSIIYSILISSNATHVVPVQTFNWPWMVIYYSIQKLITEPDLDIWLNLILGFAFLILFILAWPKMRMSYKIYSLVIVIASFSYYTGPFHPYMGLLRHLLLAFPVFIYLPSIIKESKLMPLLVSTSIFAMFFCLSLYVFQAWVP